MLRGGGTGFCLAADICDLLWFKTRVTSSLTRRSPTPVKPFSPSFARQLRTALADWYRKSARDLPWRRDSSPYAVLVSEFMLQQTQVVTATAYFERWMRRFPNIQTLADAPEQDVLKEWQGLGYYSRARNLHKAAKEIVARFGGDIPDAPAELLTLPGVGPYSAGAVAAFAFDRPAAAVDANIARVLARLANLDTPIDSPAGSREIWRIATELLPEASGGRIHTSALMELGAMVCLPRLPQCLICPIQSLCRAKSPESLPVKSPRRATIAIREHAAWIVQKDQLLLEQQKGKRAGGLWKLPSMNQMLANVPVLYEGVYPFTHHKITLTVQEADLPPPENNSHQWFPLETVLTDAPLTAGHRRAIEALVKKQTNQASAILTSASPT